jgi:hypothetical protein
VSKKVTCAQKNNKIIQYRGKHYEIISYPLLLVAPEVPVIWLRLHCSPTILLYSHYFMDIIIKLIFLISVSTNPMQLLLLINKD